MSKLIKNAVVALVLGIFSVSMTVQAQKIYSGNFSFLGHDYTNVPSGIYTPTGASKQDAVAAYERWWDKYVVNAKDNTYRVKWDDFAEFPRGGDKNSVSEGIAYGMLLSAYAGDKVTFDKLYAYYRMFPHYNTIHNVQTQIMNWKTCNPSSTSAFVDDGTCENAKGRQPDGNGGATDAEFDVAMACIVASYQWPAESKYVDFAKLLIKQIRKYEFTSDGHMKSGDGWRDDQNITNISYFSPAYYRVFKDYDNENPGFWDTAIEKCYTTLAAAATNNGLVRDWTTRAGGVSSEAATYGYDLDGKAFLYDAVRTPLRIGLDYLWFQEPRAQAYCKKTTAFAVSKGGVKNLEAGYTIDGNSLYPGSNNNATFAGCFAIGGMAANNSSFVNQAYTGLKEITPGQGHYFDETIKTISLFIMTGNIFPVPPCVAEKPDLGTVASLCNTTSLASDITADSYQWYLGAQALGTTKSISVTKAGVYTLITKQNNCPQSAKVEVVAATVAAGFIAQPGAGNVFLTSTSTGGISDYSWKVDGEEVATTENHVLSGLASGSYEISLTVNNSGFAGCTATNTITKTVNIGDGDGWALDDFNDWDYSWTWFSPGGFFDYGGDLNGNAKSAGPGDFDCSLAQMKCIKGGAAGQYQPFGVSMKEPKANKTCSDDDPLDVTVDMGKAPFVQIRIMSTTAVNLGIGVHSKGVDATSARQFAALEAGVWTTVDLNFSGGFTYWTETNANTPLDSTDIDAIQFFPYEKATTYLGTISIDYIVVGSAGLSKPNFDYKLNAAGTDFLWVEDGTGAKWPTTCKVDGGALKYVRVPQWNKQVSSCTDKTTIEVKSCTADEIRWFNGSSLIGTGAISPELGKGKYYVELINEGGVLRDSVDVTVGGTPFVQFTYDTEDFGYGYRFKPTSSDIDSLTWNYDIANAALPLSFPEARTSDEGYQYYTADDYEGQEVTVKLTGTNKKCGTKATYSETFIVKCAQDPYEFTFASDLLANDTIKICGGLELTVDAAVNYVGSTEEEILAGTTGITNFAAWYGFNGAKSMGATKSVTFTPAFSNYLKLTTDSKCGDKIEDSIYVMVSVQPKVVWKAPVKAGYHVDFSHKTTGYTVPGTEDFSWTIDGNAITAAQDKYAYGHDFTTTGKHVVCIQAGYDCEAEAGIVKGCDTVDVVCPLPKAPEVSNTNDQLDYVFVNLTKEAGVTYSWTVDGLPKVANTTGGLDVTLTEGPHDVCLTATNGCVLTTAPKKCVAVTASLVCVDEPALAFTATSSEMVTKIVATETNVTNVVWKVDNEVYTPSAQGTFDIVFTTPGVHKVCVSASATDGACTAPTQVCKDDIVAELVCKQEPVLTFAYTADELVASITSTQTNVKNVVWTLDGAPYTPSTPKAFDMTFTNEGKYKVCLSGVASDAACPSPSQVCEDIQVSLECLVPEVVFTTAEADGVVTVSVSSSTAESYAWTATGATPATSTVKEPVFTYTTNNTYAIKLKASKACGEFKEYTKDVVVSICPAVVANFTATNTEFNVVVTNTSVGATKYAWTATGATPATSALMNPTFVYTSKGQMDIKLVASNECGKSNEKILPVTVEGIVCANPAVAAFEVTSDGLVAATTNSSTGRDITYAWTATGATPSTSTSTNPTFTYPTAGDYNIKLDVKDACGTVKSSTKSVTIVKVCDEKPLADFSATAAAGSGNVSISNISTGAIKYAWTAVSATPSSSIEKTPAFTYAVSGDYEISLIAENGCGETSSAKKTVKICFAPVANFTASSDAERNVTVSNLSEGTGLTYAWTATGATPSTSVAKTPVFVYSEDGDFGITLKVTNSCGASHSRETTVTVKQGQACNAPTVDFSLDAVKFDVTVMNSTVADSYLWTTTDAGAVITSATSKSPKITFSKEGTFKVTLKATMTCGATSSSFKEVEISSDACKQPVADFTAEAVQKTIKVTSTSKNAASYSWTLDGVQKNKISEKTSFEVTTNGTYTVCLEVGPPFECTSVTKDKICKDVVVDGTGEPEPCAGTPMPDLGNDRSLCGVDSIILHSNVTDTDVRFDWYQNGSNAGLKDSVYVVRSVGVYIVKVTKNNCSNRDTLEIFAKSDISASFDVVVSSSQVTITNTSTGGELTSSWYNEGTLVTNETDYSFTFDSATTQASVCLAVSNGCTSDSLCTIIRNVDGTQSVNGVADLIEAGIITVVPTLVNDIVNVNIDELINTEVYVTIISATGRVMSQSTILSSTAFDLSEAPRGVYVIYLVSDLGVGSVKIMKD